VTMAQVKTSGRAKISGERTVTEIRFVMRNIVTATKNKMLSRYRIRIKCFVESRGRESALYVVRKSTESSKAAKPTKPVMTVGSVFVMTHIWVSGL